MTNARGSGAGRRRRRVCHPGNHRGWQALPAQRLGRAPVRRHVGVRRRPPDAVFALRAPSDVERRALRGGRRAARGARADGLPLSPELREGQRAQGPRWPGGRANQARGDAAGGGYGLSYFMPLRAWASRLLCRSAALRCRMPFATTRSITFCDSRIVLAAASLLPAETAFAT